MGVDLKMRPFVWERSFADVPMKRVRLFCDELIT